jgi:hypothetical protein
MIRARRVPLVLALCVASVASSVSAQAPASPSAALNVYLDCNDFQGCDFDFFRTEITRVNWVRDRQVADIHILVTTQSTGSGGREYTNTFIGLKGFAGITDTIKYNSQPAATQDEIRRGLARTFRAGLVRYIVRTDAADKLIISFGDTVARTTAEGAARKHDPWNYWVFRTSASAFNQGEAQFTSGSINLNGSANRTTEKWKTSLSLYTSYSESSFKLSSGEEFTNIQRSQGSDLLQVKSITDHVSAGFRSSVSASTYQNQQYQVTASPAIEYNIFPYSQSTRRQIRLEYNVGFQRVAYNDTTIFGKMRENLPTHSFGVSAATRETWGSIDIGTSAVNYLHDLSKYNVNTFGSASLRLFKGFSLNGFVNYSKFNDQFYLPKRDFTDEQILTRQFAQQSTYRYFYNVGISYTFGSIFNNVVNPRFGGGGGGMIMF